MGKGRFQPGGNVTEQVLWEDYFGICDRWLRRRRPWRQQIEAWAASELMEKGSYPLGFISGLVALLSETVQILQWKTTGCLPVTHFPPLFFLTKSWLCLGQQNPLLKILTFPQIVKDVHVTHFWPMRYIKNFNRWRDGGILLERYCFLIEKS